MWGNIRRIFVRYNKIRFLDMRCFASFSLMKFTLMLSFVLMHLCTQDCTWQINIGIHLHTQTHWTPLMDPIYAVINGINEVCTMWSGVLLSAFLACALLAHFASQVRTLLSLRLAPFPSAQVGRKTQHLRPTCALPFLRLMASISGVHCQTSSEWWLYLHACKRLRLTSWL